MLMNIKESEKYTHITIENESFDDFKTSFKGVQKQYEQVHLIISFSENNTSFQEWYPFLLEVSTSKKENGTSFVVVDKNTDIDNITETFNIVPSFQEAEDIIELENIERTLGL